MGRLNLENLTTEEKEKLKSYVESVKEIKKEIREMLHKAKANPVQEKTGGNESTGKIFKLPPNM
jgi:glycine cleavage system protein P-like pyridoxal-binding family